MNCRLYVIVMAEKQDEKHISFAEKRKGEMQKKLDKSGFLFYH